MRRGWKTGSAIKIKRYLPIIQTIVGVWVALFRLSTRTDATKCLLLWHGQHNRTHPQKLRKKFQGKCSWRTGVPSGQTEARRKNGAMWTSLSSKTRNSCTWHRLSRQYPVLGEGWLENIFAENYAKVQRRKLNMLFSLKAGKRSIT